jgi:hypothetical protein
MLPYQQLFHNGVVVADLEAAMATLGKAFDLQWTQPHRFSGLSLWTPERGLESIDLLVSYSRQGPQRLELIEAKETGFYSYPREPGPHHAGIWVDDLAHEIRQLRRQGWQVAAAGGSPDENYGLFAYLEHAHSHLLLELVSTELRPALESWWAGGSLNGTP